MPQRKYTVLSARRSPPPENPLARELESTLRLLDRGRELEDELFTGLETRDPIALEQAQAWHQAMAEQQAAAQQQMQAYAEQMAQSPLQPAGFEPHVGAADPFSMPFPDPFGSDLGNPFGDSVTPPMDMAYSPFGDQTPGYVSQRGEERQARYEELRKQREEQRQARIERHNQRRAAIMERKDGHVARFQRAKIAGVEAQDYDVLFGRARFNAEVRPHLTEIPIGKQGIGFDRVDLDAWVDDYKSRNGRPGRQPEGETTWDESEHPVSLNGPASGTSTNRSTGGDFARALEQVASKKQNAS